MSLNELKELERIARAKYANCGCTVYKKEAENLAARIKDLENKIKQNG